MIDKYFSILIVNKRVLSYYTDEAKPVAFISTLGNLDYFISHQNCKNKYLLLHAIN